MFKAPPSLFGFLLAANAIANPSDTVIDTVAVMGDSAATGAIADPKWNFSSGLFNLVPRTKGSRVLGVEAYRHVFTDLGLPPNNVLTRPQWFVPGEMSKDEKGKVVQQLLVDTQQFSSSYMAMRVLGVSPASIYFYAQHHGFAKHYVKQVDTLGKVSPGRLPSLTLLAGASVLDFCSNSMLSDDVKKQKALNNYREKLKQAFLALGALKQPPWYRRRVVLFAPLPIADILRSEPIRDKQVSVFNKRFSCEQIRTTAEYKFTESGRNMVRALTDVCPMMMRTSSFDVERNAKIESLFGEVKKLQQEAIDEANSDPATGSAEFMLFGGPQNIEWEATDIADDCLRPSIYGNAKIARKLIEFLKAN